MQMQGKTAFTWRSVGKAKKKALRKAAHAVLAKAAMPEPAQYVYVRDRDDRYHCDPSVRAAAWHVAEGAFLAKSRAATGGVTPGQLHQWLLVARTDPNPAVREAMWAAIYEASGGAQ